MTDSTVTGGAEYPGAEWVPPLPDDDVTKLAYVHSQAVTSVGRDCEVCRVCTHVFPCPMYSLAVEVLGRRGVEYP